MNNEDSLLSDAACGLLSDVLGNRGRGWHRPGGLALTCAGQERSTCSLQFPSVPREWQWDLLVLYIQGYGQDSAAVQVSRASWLPGCGILRSLGVLQRNTVEGVCVGQSGLAASLQHSRRFPLSPERSTGMQHRKFPLLNPRPWACGVGWKLAYG